MYTVTALPVKRTGWKRNYVIFPPSPFHRLRSVSCSLAAPSCLRPFAFKNSRGELTRVHGITRAHDRRRRPCRGPCANVVQPFKRNRPTAGRDDHARTTSVDGRNRSQDDGKFKTYSGEVVSSHGPVAKRSTRIGPAVVFSGCSERARF